MEILETGLQDSFILKPKIFADERGYFFESYNANAFANATGISINFVQDNQAKSNKNVLRGLHFQKGDAAQAKLVSVIQGKVFDVIVDLRINSKSFGKYFSVELSAENKWQLFIPRGFAHGYMVLEDNTEFFYKCDNYYNKEMEGGIIYNDTTLNINWETENQHLIIATKDLQLPGFDQIEYFI
jgi:dTDP-4-dehydrorhamnose 3,5-epimerase